MDSSEQPKDLAKRATDLAGGELGFKHQFNTPGELLAVGAHNSAELARIEAIGAEVPGRIWNLACLIMAEVWQPVIVNSQDPKAALRQFLSDKILSAQVGEEQTTDERSFCHRRVYQ